MTGHVRAGMTATTTGVLSDDGGAIVALCCHWGPGGGLCVSQKKNQHTQKKQEFMLNDTQRCLICNIFAASYICIHTKICIYIYIYTETFDAEGE